MYLLDLSLRLRVIIGISAMTLLFASFLVAFVSSQRRKLQYHRVMLALQEEQKEALLEQNNQLEKKVNERTVEILEQKEELQKSLTELKSTQLQLVQKEKMASLGELTAGIAHEIQNPLNFVNNFSEVSKELAEELETEAVQKNWDEVLQLANNLKENLTKVNQHGKRADAIVKGMLQHSKMLSETKELTDINDLVDEYLQLTYHSVKAKNKGFNVELKTEFDGSLERVNVYPQDLGQVLVNLYNNAFYSMREKKRKVVMSYLPRITVCTKRIGEKVFIHVKDNGCGIPQKLTSKIFQPFFTTKPTGEGTGLGLSLSYDIVTKGHGGTIDVYSKEGEGAEFIIKLPVN